DRRPAGAEIDADSEGGGQGGEVELVGPGGGQLLDGVRLTPRRGGERLELVGVVARPADHQVVALTADEDVVPGHAAQGRVAGEVHRADVVVAGVARQGGLLEGRERVGAGAGGGAGQRRIGQGEGAGRALGGGRDAVGAGAAEEEVVVVAAGAV